MTKNKKTATLSVFLCVLFVCIACICFSNVTLKTNTALATDDVAGKNVVFNSSETTGKIYTNEVGTYEAGDSEFIVFQYKLVESDPIEGRNAFKWGQENCAYDGVGGGEAFNGSTTSFLDEANVGKTYTFILKRSNWSFGIYVTDGEPTLVMSGSDYVCEGATSIRGDIFPDPGSNYIAYTTGYINLFDNEGMVSSIKNSKVFGLEIGKGYAKLENVKAFDENGNDLGVNFSEGFTEAKDDIIGKNIVINNGAIDLNLYINAALGANKVKLSYTKADTTLVEETKDLAEVYTTTNPVLAQYNGSYKVKISVPAKMMTVPFTIQAMKDSISVGDSYTTSVKDYLEELISSSDVYDDVANAMLNYGSAVQSVLDYKEDDLAADLTSFDSAFEVGQIDSYQIVDNSSKVTGIALVAESTFTLKINFSDGAEEGATVAGADYSVEDGYILIKGIDATKLDNGYVITLADSTTVTVSVLSYVYKVNESSTASAEYKNLAKAIYNYYTALNALIAA